MNRNHPASVVTLTLVLALALVACGRTEESPGGGAGSPSAGGSAPPEESMGPATGQIDVWAMGTEGDNLDVLAEDFMDANPDVTVEVTAVPWDAAHDRIATAIAGGEVPDASLIGTTWMGEFASAGGLDPTPSSIDPSSFFQGAWDTTVVDGTSYGVPWYVETRLVYYRTDQAEAGGVSQAPGNWDDLRALAEAEESGGAEWGLALQPGGIGSWQTFMPFFWQAGGEILDDSGAFTLDSDACREALAYYDSYFEDGLAATAASDTPLEAQFASGEVGGFISGPWMINIVNDAGADPETWTVAHQPTEQTGTSFVGGGNFAVFNDSDNKAAAWAFVEYLSQPDVQAKWYDTVSDLPAVQAAWEDPALADDPLLSAFGDQLTDAKAPPAIATWEQVAAEAIDPIIEQVTVGDMSPEDGCATMQSSAESIGTGM
ncbi:MAG TPA: sugar ABC transporter substrate-binding protein [Candidatus Limnocylindria bacterium]|nr:sugar ABC transporter substrate-binding protein [Candidatus Limnocylindria bacterium]